jgi:threonine synthase
VSDAEILAAKAAVDAAGIGCEPASAAAVAGVRRLRARGAIAADARVVAVLTGHVLKDPGAVVSYHRGEMAKELYEGGARNAVQECAAEELEAVVARILAL